VISDPDRSAASTTIVACARPAMMRFRAGKFHLNARKPGGISEMTTPARASC
jgi:hypothetical protein